MSVDELLTEDIPVSVLTGLLNNNLLVVVRQLVHDKLDLLVELQLVELRDALGRDGDSACFCQLNVRILNRSWGPLLIQGW